MRAGNSAQAGELLANIRQLYNLDLSTWSDDINALQWESHTALTYIRDLVSAPNQARAGRRHRYENLQRQARERLYRLDSWNSFHRLRVRREMCDGVSIDDAIFRGVKRCDGISIRSSYAATAHSREMYKNLRALPTQICKGFKKAVRDIDQLCKEANDTAESVSVLANLKATTPIGYVCFAPSLQNYIRKNYIKGWGESHNHTATANIAQFNNVIGRVHSNNYNLLDVSLRVLHSLDMENGVMYATYYRGIRGLTRGITTRTRLGKYLTWLGINNNETIKQIIASFDVPKLCPVWLIKNHEWNGSAKGLQDEWKTAYEDIVVDYSCMKGSDGPRAYGHPAPWNRYGLVTFENDVIDEMYCGRAIVTWNEDGSPKNYLRVYPAENAAGPMYSEYSISRWLEAQGFAPSRKALDGFAIAALPWDYTDSFPTTIRKGIAEGEIEYLSIIAPYIDGENYLKRALHVTENGECYIRLTSEYAHPQLQYQNVAAHNTCGHVSIPDLPVVLPPLPLFPENK